MKKTAVILGVGPLEGLGARLSIHASRANLHVFVAGRTPSSINEVVAEIEKAGGTAEAFPSDATEQKEVRSLINAAENKGPIDLAIYNAGNAYPGDFMTMTPEYFEEAWRVCTLGGFFFSQEVLKAVLPRNTGTIIFTGASASIRGKPNFSAFTAGKSGLRALAQSLAREFQPQGIHIGHIVIDGGILGEKLTSNYPDFVRSAGPDGLIGLDGLAEAFMQLYMQPRNAWTHEMDLRTFKESF
ncbi:MAG: glucose 1-dehydrogenase [Gammaproteobacteria bacterium]|nr:glucose 1-dehydrogenase [Gammaproteobacteria bacterium]|tara:strand:- start:122 stop:847 length:726 start_codon:yes stop_codon:yes gene_type:complete